MNYRIFDQRIFEDLQLQAQTSPRKRAHFNIHHSYNEPVQKVLICLLRDTYIPPHYHTHVYQTELFIVLQGSVKLIIFDENGGIKRKIVLGDGSGASMVEIEPKLIHTIVCESDIALIMEVKEGPFLKDDCKVFPSWSVNEANPKATIYLEELRGKKQ